MKYPYQQISDLVPGVVEHMPIEEALALILAYLYAQENVIASLKKELAKYQS